MAERKKGPVKPPMIDLTARTGDATDSPPPTPEDDRDSPEPEPVAAPNGVRSTTALPLLLAAGMCGGVLGAALSLALAAAGLFPGPAPDARIETLASEVNALRAAMPPAGLDTALVALGSDVASLKSAIASLPPAEKADLSAITAELTALSDRLDAVAAGASSADAGAIAARLDALATSLADLDDRLTEGEAAVTALPPRLEALEATVGELSTAQLQQAERAESQAPLLLAALESAWASGRPFAAELAGLRSLDPDLALPETLAAAAETGLARPDTIGTNFRALVPALAGAIPTLADASWQDQAMGWIRGLLAIRPSGELAGDNPEAVLSRLEAAIERRDFAAAAPLFAALPAPMQAIAGDLQTQIAAWADAETFMAAQRARPATAEGQP